ncbi:hypothetical protein N7452_007856 [Penicillium brevicompactum]|uniref:BZIP domain-containing protein n=1 Tax=Penicillium brevicompactum TaxID=5074 RepID=A0A9W9QGA1_PENBR|nr:hypothetical protein N7452_007856 [Penicillium brevicompactum]
MQDERRIAADVSEFMRLTPEAQLNLRLTSNPQHHSTSFFTMAPQADSPPAGTPSNIPDQLDPATKRKIQNRLNQRASRKRKALEAANNLAANKKWVVYTDESTISNSINHAQKPNQPDHKITRISPNPTDCQSICNFSLNANANANASPSDAILYEVYLRALHGLQNPTISPNISSHVSQYSLLSATFINARFLGLTLDLLNDDLASQFNIVGPSSLHLPPSLWPSKSQRKIIHHPWIDLIPILSLRESILRRMDTLDEDEACGDLFGMCTSSSGETGLRVWGEAWDPLAWEASTDLIKKWSWIMNECPDVIKSTNYWRKQRGEKAVVIELE